MLRPLEEPMRTWTSRRGGVVWTRRGDACVAPAKRCATGLHTRVPRESRGAGACGWLAQGDASVPPPHRTAPAPTRVADALQKTLPLRAGGRLRRPDQAVRNAQA